MKTLNGWQCLSMILSQKSFGRFYMLRYVISFHPQIMYSDLDPKIVEIV